MRKQSYSEIVNMIKNACNENFHHGVGEIRGNVIECATKIFIEQMRLDAYGPCVDTSAQAPNEED